jgi:hypothetical protein
MSGAEPRTARSPTKARTTQGRRAKSNDEEEQKRLLKELREVDDRLRNLLRLKFRSDEQIQRELGIYESPKKQVTHR